MTVNKSKLLASFTFASGLLLLLIILLPLAFSTIRYRISSSYQLYDPTQVSQYPLPQIVGVLGISAVDYSRPEVWFDAPPPTAISPTTVNYYTVSLPRLKIINAPVEVGGQDLKKNAIHYTGSALPGDWGNTVIFGHSSLPQLYRPGNPLTIFNPLLQAKAGDEISIKFDGVTYNYLVKSTVEVTPRQVEVLAQRFDRRELTLITCTPLGTYWRRFVVRAELVN